VPRAETGNGHPLSESRIESSLRAFRAAIGVRGDRDATPEEIARVAEGRIDVADFLRQINATAPAVGYEDLTFSADKSVSICYALAPTAAERAIILAGVHGATDDAMAYAETVLGVGRRGAGGQGEAERGEIFWVAVQHYTSRPAVDFVRLDADGQEFTDIREVPMAKSDPNLHQHRIIPSSVLTESGRVVSLDLSRLKGEQKVMGAVFHASLATRLGKAGVKTELGPNGEARISGIPDWVRKFHSRRSTQGEKSARELAKQEGKDWDSLNGEQKAALVSTEVAKERQAKADEPRRANDEGPAEIPIWRQDARDAGYRHRSVLRPRAPRRVLSHEQRIEIAREASLPLLAKAYETRAVLSGGEVREIAARGLIVSGIGQRPADDIEAVCKTFRERGVKVRGEWTHLEWGIDYGENGKKQTVVTTGHTLDQESRLTRLVQSIAADKSGALTPAQIDRAAERFLAKHPKIDPDGAQWKAQLAMAHQIGEGGRFSLSIGVAGSGKTSSVLAVLIDAWHAEGKTVYGMTVPWKASTALRDAGADQSLAIAAFLDRVEKRKIRLDANSIIIADEVSMIGVTQQLALAEVAKRSGARLAEIGDPRQCQSVENPALDLMARAIGDKNIPKLLTTIRQSTERGREVATMFRDGRATEGLAAMQEVGRMHLVAGSPEQVIRHTTALWREMTDANKTDPEYSLIVMTPTNQQARAVGTAIRQDRRAVGEIGRGETTVRAMDPNSKESFDLALSVGDKIRTFTRTYDADVGTKKRISNNGDVVEIREILQDGLRVRNADGEEGRVPWAQLKPWRAPKNDPVRITYGYAVTVDTAQSRTETAAIFSMPDGSKQVTGYKAYTALSRHVADAHLVISDSAERKEIVRRHMRGLSKLPTRPDVIQNVAANLSRFPAKSQATETLRRVADIRRGTVARRPRTTDAPELTADMNAIQRRRLAPALDRVSHYVQEIQRHAMDAVRHAQRIAHDYGGPSLPGH
jgi:hypothetical protein